MYIIAEISGNHNQDLGLAIEMVHAAKEAGANAIKTQAYDADELTFNCKKEWFHVKHEVWGGQTLWELYNKAHTPWHFHDKLKEVADEIGIEYISTAYDVYGAHLLLDMGLKKIKVASFEFTYVDLVDLIAYHADQMLISTGMASWEDIVSMRTHIPDNAVVFHCTSAYPARPIEMGLRSIEGLKKVFSSNQIGLSDHSQGSLAPLLSLGMGATYLEKHFMLHKDSKSVDSHFSMCAEDFAKMVKDIRAGEQMLSYNYERREEAQQKYIWQRRSLFFNQRVKKGQRIESHHMSVIRPGYGASPLDQDEIIGKIAPRDFEYGDPVPQELAQCQR